MPKTVKTLHIRVSFEDNLATQANVGGVIDSLNSLESVNCTVTAAIKPPSRHLMAFLTFLSLLPLVYFIPPMVAQWLQANELIHVTISVAFIVPLISYLIMPFLVKRLA